MNFIDVVKALGVNFKSDLFTRYYLETYLQESLMVKFMSVMLAISLLAACGISSDNIYGPSYETVTTRHNVGSVVAGSLYSGLPGDKVIMNSLFMPAQVYSNGNFFFENVPQGAPVIEVPVKAVLISGGELWSYFQGSPAQNANITLIEHYDWHNSTGTSLIVQDSFFQPMPAVSSVYINPFTNLAYWLDNTRTYAGFSGKLLELNNLFFGSNLSPACQADKGLCAEHLAFFASGNSISVSNDGVTFSLKNPGKPVCNGLIATFPAPCI